MRSFPKANSRERTLQRQTERAGSWELLLLLLGLALPTTTLAAPGALSSPLPGELLHFQLQTVYLVSEVLLEEPVVQLGRLAASLSLAQSGCEPYGLVIKNKSHGGEEDQVYNTK